ncbi:MAG: N-(5'-phosphoribosyl)anthranilate isomerase [bacterium]
MTWVKICGVQTTDNAMELADMRLDALGINRYEPSSRYVDLGTASELTDRIRRVDSDVDVVGVYVNESLKRIREDHDAVGWDIIQLHGDESPDYTRSAAEMSRVMKAFQVQEDFDVESFGGFQSWSYLLDAYHPERYGGTGETAPWERIRFLTDDYRIVLAGGLTPGNVIEAISTVQPWGIDVCSGVETDEGLKDVDKVRDLLDDVRRHEFDH